MSTFTMPKLASQATEPGVEFAPVRCAPLTGRGASRRRISKGSMPAGAAHVGGSKLDKLGSNVMPMARGKEKGSDDGRVALAVARIEATRDVVLGRRTLDATAMRLIVPMRRESESDRVSHKSDRLLGVREVASRTNLSRPTLYRLEQAGKFPKRVQVSANRVAWRESDISAWIASRKGRRED